MNLNSSGSGNMGVISSLNNKLEQQLMGNKTNQKSSLKAVFKNVHVYRDFMVRFIGNTCFHFADQSADQCLSINYVLKEKKQKSSKNISLQFLTLFTSSFFNS
jgi:hypothetical protein